MTEHVRYVVEAMIGTHHIPESLVTRINDVQALMAKTGGKLQSRQVIAMIVVEWRRSLR